MALERDTVPSSATNEVSVSVVTPLPGPGWFACTGLNWPASDPGTGSSVVPVVPSALKFSLTGVPV